MAKPVWSDNSRYLAFMEELNNEWYLVIVRISLNKKDKIFSEIRKKQIHRRNKEKIPKFKWDKKASELYLIYSGDVKPEVLLVENLFK